MFSLTSLTAIIKNRNNTDNLVHQRSPCHDLRRLEKDEHEKDDAPHLESSYRRINILVIRRKMHGANMLLPLPKT